MAAMKPKSRPDLAVFEVEDELVLFDPEVARVHHLNPTGGLVFRLCDGTATMAETASEIAEIYKMGAKEVEPEVRAAVRDLRKAGLLVQKPLRSKRSPAPEVVLVTPEREPPDGSEARPADETDPPAAAVSRETDGPLTGDPELDEEHADGRERIRMEVPRST